MEKSEFAVSVLKQYALENQVTTRSTSDLSPLEQWLILQLFAKEKPIDTSCKNCKNYNPINITPCSKTCLMYDKFEKIEQDVNRCWTCQHRFGELVSCYNCVDNSNWIPIDEYTQKFLQEINKQTIEEVKQMYKL